MDKYKKFKTQEEVEKWVKNNYNIAQLLEIKNYYKKEDPYNIGWYKGSKYIIYNSFLQNSTITEEELREKLLSSVNKQKRSYMALSIKMNPNFLNKACIQKEIATLNSYITDNEIKEDITVYRFVTKYEFDYLTENRNIKTVPHFLSTTLLNSKTKEYPHTQRRHIIKIFIPQGSKGLYLPDVNFLYPENEILFPHHSQLKPIKTGFWNKLIEHIPTFEYLGV